MSARNETSWRRYSNVVIAPAVANMTWDSFSDAKKLIELGEQAATAVIPSILKWLPKTDSVKADGKTFPVTAAVR
jgi:hypothetical protein